MAVPQVIAVSPRGSGTPLLAQVTTALGYTPYGTMSDPRPDGAGEAPGPGEVHRLLTAAYGPDRAALLLRRQDGEWDRLETAYQDAVSALWRVWWTRLGQPVTAASPVGPGPEDRLTRIPDADLLGLLPGRGCWYVNSLDLQCADAGLLRLWQATGRPPVVFHHRDVRDRIVSQIRMLCGPADEVGSLPDHLVYRDIVGALPGMDARITLALTDPGFPGMEDARRCAWLLHHPAVCVLTHEELAGPAHGGTAEARREALDRLRNAVGAPSSGAPLPAPVSPADHARDGDDLTVGIWRCHFTPAHERLLQQRHADLLAHAPVPGAHA
ncbi:hypothetical protein [Streptomyces sp. NPDC059142]|uniref:hypothetical protein n=1 Tax=Streptomyces sp. NPDC059142 TaxID=3346739 RepID=UPI0036BAD5FF